MKNNLKNFFGILVLPAMILAGCGKAVQPSSKITREQRQIVGFSGIEVSDAFTVYVNITDHDGIEIEANENLHPYIITKKKGDKLIIGFKDYVHLVGHPTLTVYVSAKELNNFSESGASGVILTDSLKTENIKVELSGASSFIGTLEAKNIAAELSGASSLNISGVTEVFELKASGASTAENFNLSCKTLNVHLSGASKVRVTAHEKLAVEASGASEIIYKGTGIVTSQDLSGASSLHKR